MCNLAMTVHPWTVVAVSCSEGNTAKGETTIEDDTANYKTPIEAPSLRGEADEK